MDVFATTRKRAAWAIGLLACILAVYAIPSKADVVRITNANDHEIPIAVGTTPEIDDEGNVLVECALNASDICAALFSGQVVTGAPTVSLSRNDNNSAVTTGEFISLTWGTTLATACTATETGPVPTTWSGAKDTSEGGGEQIAFTTEGSYSFMLQCFNTAGPSPIEVETVVVGEGDPEAPPDESGCELTDPDIEPAGYTRVDKTWTQLFTLPAEGNKAQFPGGQSYPTPIPHVDIDEYSVTPFQLAANQYLNLYFDQAQPRGSIYNPARPADSMFITISPCPGDFRAINGGSADEFLHGGCRKFENSGSLVFGTPPGFVFDSAAGCNLEPLTQYFINVIAADPSGGIDSPEETCSDTAPAGCDVGAVISGN